MTPQARPSEMERARKLATEMLMERLADDALDLEEFERRLDQVNAAAEVEEIAKILGQVAAANPYAPIPRGWKVADSPASAADMPELVPKRKPGRLRRLGRQNKVVLALQDGSGRVGRWAPSKHVWVINMLGGAVMDFREATLPRGVTEVTVFCIMGDVEIVVPLDIQVEFGGLGLIGGFDYEPTVGVSNPDAPTLRINGVSCLGGVTVSVRDRGEEAPAPRTVPRKLRGRSATEPEPSRPGPRRRRKPDPALGPPDPTLRPSGGGTKS